MHPQQYPSLSSAPPPYNSNMKFNQEEYHQSMPNYHTSNEERMIAFQQVVDRYESKIVIL